MQHDLEKGAEIIENFIRNRYSDELGYDTGRDGFPSTFLIMDLKQAKNKNLVIKTKEVLTHMMKSYNFNIDGYTDNNYLYELTTLSTFYRVPETVNFLERAKSSEVYTKLSENPDEDHLDLKHRIDRCIYTFEQENKN